MKRIFSHAEWYKAVDDCALRLWLLGARRGMRIGITGILTPLQVISFFALMRLGAIACPFPSWAWLMHVKLASKIQLDGLIEEEGENTDKIFPSPPLRIDAKPLRNCSSEIRKETCEEKLEAKYEREPHPTQNGNLPRFITWGEEMDRIVTMIPTSGSSGERKVVLHTLRQHFANAKGANLNAPLAPGDLWLASIPLHHIGGVALLFRVWTAQARWSVGSPFDWEECRSIGVTHLSMTSIQLDDWINMGEKSRSSSTPLKAIVVSGGNFSASTLDRAYALGLPLVLSYTLTEMSSQVTATPLKADRAQWNTCGYALQGREWTLREEEILVRGETLAEGYLGETPFREQFEGGWFPTGDLGKGSDRGLIILGRKVDQCLWEGREVHASTLSSFLRSVLQDEKRRIIVVPYGQERSPIAMVEGLRNRELLGGIVSLPWPEHLLHGGKLKWERSDVLEYIASFS